jgi:hypothetical protein
MKKMRIGFMLATLAALACFAQTWGQTNFYEQVSSMWYSGNKTGVLSIAEQRLQQNTNDIAGLLLKLEYEVEFLQLSNVTNTMRQALIAGETFAGTNFTQVYPVLQADYEVMKIVVTNYPPDELAADQAKSSIAGKTMSCDAAIKALQDDGYFGD